MACSTAASLWMVYAFPPTVRVERVPKLLAMSGPHAGEWDEGLLVLFEYGGTAATGTTKAHGRSSVGFAVIRANPGLLLVRPLELLEVFFHRLLGVPRQPLDLGGTGGLLGRLLDLLAHLGVRPLGERRAAGAAAV